MEKYRRVLSHDTEKWCKVWQKVDSWFQKWHEEFGEQVVESKFNKSSLYHVLAEGMWFLDKSSPSNFNFLDFPLLVWSCPNSSCNFWNQELVFV